MVKNSAGLQCLKFILLRVSVLVGLVRLRAAERRHFGLNFVTNIIGANNKLLLHFLDFYSSEIENGSNTKSKM